MFFCDVSQQVLFAQHAGAHAFSLGAFEKMHEAAGSRIDAPKNAAARIIDGPILLTITPFYSTIRAVRRMHPYKNKASEFPTAASCVRSFVISGALQPAGALDGAMAISLQSPVAMTDSGTCG